MTVYNTEDMRELTKKFVEQIHNYTKVARHRVNIQKSIIFPHTNNERVEFEIRNTISLTLTSLIIKYLGINPTKCVQELYEKKYKTNV